MMIKSLWVENKQVYDDTTYDMHLHEKWEINFILTDGVDILVNDTLYTSKYGDIFIFPAFSFHRANLNHIKYSRFLIYYDERDIAEIANILTPAIRFLKNTGINLIHLNEDETDKMKVLLNEAYFAQSKHGLFSDFEIVCAFGKILSFMIDKIDVEKHLNSVEKENDDILSNILSYISQNIDDDLSIPSICEKFNISKSTLWNMMKSSTGISMNKFIFNIRISRAIDLLLKGFSVTEVANMCGFHSYAHFIRAFTKTIGTSPHQYRKNHISQM